MITIVQLKGTHPISGKESESKFCDRFWCFIHTNPHSVFTFRAGMKSKIPSKASKTKGNGNKVDVLENIRSKVSKTKEKGNQIDLLELKTKYEDLSNENVELKTEIQKSEEKTKRMMDDLKLMCQQIEASRVDQEKKLESTDEKIKKLEKENHDLKQHNWHLKMVKLPHYVKLLHQKDEEIAELESRNQVGYLKDCAENLLKEKDKPEEITLDEDDDDDICEIDIEPVSKPSLPQVVNLDLEADNGEDKSDILLIGQKKEETSDGTTFKLEERKLSEKTQLTGIIDAMMQTPDARSTIKKEEVSDPELTSLTPEACLRPQLPSSQLLTVIDRLGFNDGDISTSLLSHDSEELRTRSIDPPKMPQVRTIYWVIYSFSFLSNPGYTGH